MGLPDNFSDVAFESVWGNEQTDIINDIERLEKELLDLKCKLEDEELDEEPDEAEIERLEALIYNCQEEIDELKYSLG
ncbi:hypothetical protein [Swingsia samuiensis]|uniref:Uncharacterized protein n=1 Tax=Swingsia samuiensis TaxID=1293412 RepID=A0A4Y6UM18_9PROT|nr:hypothetical protein [Swingsia samuiensis]QDH17441.1 hypothetical protein E3D00_07595 [Swingsia samuiensis]